MFARHITLLTLVGMLVGLTGCATSPAAVVDSEEMYQGTRLDPPVELTDFTMPSQDGSMLSLSDLQGKPVLMFFGYTFCPDICPTTMAEFVHVKRNLGEDADKVAFVFVSVDGERDTPEVLARHLSAFDDAFIGLQGDDVTLQRIGKEYGLYYKKNNNVQGTSAAYLVDHSTAAYLIDPQGRLDTIYTYGTPPDIMTTGVRTLLDSA